MKKTLLVISGILLLIFGFSTVSARSNPKPSAESAVLMNAVSGKILYAKNATTIMAPASTTKIMTAILTLERLNLNSTVIIHEKAALKEGSSMYLHVKEKKTVRELLYGLMLVSGNDAATALAEKISGSEASFAKLMTSKSRQIGMYHTNFKNASGLPEKGHYSTAYDMAILTRYAMKNANFAKIVSTKVKEVSGFKPGENRRLINHNKLLWRYQYTTGVKTGYTRAAGGCLVSTAKQGTTNLIAVVLKTSYIYDDTQKLFEYGFKTINHKSKFAQTKNSKPANS